jgi:hypothetical protein
MGTEVIDGPGVAGRVSEEGMRLIDERSLYQEEFYAAETDEARDAALRRIEESSMRINEVFARDFID